MSGVALTPERLDTLACLLQVFWASPEVRCALEETGELAAVRKCLEEMSGAAAGGASDSGSADVGTVSMDEVVASFGWSQAQPEAESSDAAEFFAVINGAADKTARKCFEGKTGRTIRCTNCENRSVRSDSFSCLSLNIKGHSTLQECLDGFSSEEVVDGYRCDACKSECDAVLTNSVGEVNDIFAVHLQRFDFDFQTFQRVKLSNKIDFGDRISLDVASQSGAGDKEPVALELFATLLHWGTADAGHYSCVVRNPDSGTWFHISGTKVNEASSSEEAHGDSQKTPYLLFYRKAGPAVKAART